MSQSPRATRYNIILADPPWDYRNGGNGRARAHYPTMPAHQILSLPVGDLAAPDCVLLLWATWPQISGAVDCIRAWGFEQVTGLPWIKIHKSRNPVFDKNRVSGPGAATPALGTGYWVRGCSEPLLIARRGRPEPPAMRGETWLGLLGPRLEHSRKPADVYQLAESWPEPRIELFARRARAGWDVWGNQAPGSITWWPTLVHAAGSLVATKCTNPRVIE